MYSKPKGILLCNACLLSNFCFLNMYRNTFSYVHNEICNLTWSIPIWYGSYFIIFIPYYLTYFYLYKNHICKRFCELLNMTGLTRNSVDKFEWFLYRLLSPLLSSKTIIYVNLCFVKPWKSFEILKRWKLSKSRFNLTHLFKINWPNSVPWAGSCCCGLEGTLRRGIFC